MHLTYRNVNDAFRTVMQEMDWGTIRSVITETRNGPCRTIRGPVILEYTSPKERVLWNEARDANPFFHVIEALWMLAGRNDVETLDWFNSNMKSYSDDGKTFHAAYGHRWYNLATPHCNPQFCGPPFDQCGYIQADCDQPLNQLRDVVQLLSDQPNTRRCVLSMWDPLDLHKVVTDPTCKDVACNTHIYFELEPHRVWREGQYHGLPIRHTDKEFTEYKLNMTVCNRSNDVLWGALGANYVHMSFLQEYIAACVDYHLPDGSVQVGTYYQFTNNLHLYKDKQDTVSWLKDSTPDYYKQPGYTPLPLVLNAITFTEEVQLAMDVIASFKSGTRSKPTSGLFQEPFLESVFLPMLHAWTFHKHRNYPMALYHASLIRSPDWARACKQWLARREANYLMTRKTRPIDPPTSPKEVQANTQANEPSPTVHSNPTPRQDDHPVPRDEG